MDNDIENRLNNLTKEFKTPSKHNKPKKNENVIISAIKNFGKNEAIKATKKAHLNSIKHFSNMIDADEINDSCGNILDTAMNYFTSSTDLLKKGNLNGVEKEELHAINELLIQKLKAKIKDHETKNNIQNDPKIEDIKTWIKVWSINTGSKGFWKPTNEEERYFQSLGNTRKNQITITKRVIMRLNTGATKKEIHQECIKEDPHLFTESFDTFRGIWEDANKSGRTPKKD